ncbi:hypothetical protein EDD37DRAFT_425134 [Exophiala viscosa]|uniref:uncharacterized protein n=1 Tax=Exophiala viscosa TaxID=2486360 RepID=UPI00218E528B|nr:hypothetical protein EDD37DRAFT_425134 [Exophiala viscosa]
MPRVLVENSILSMYSGQDGFTTTKLVLIGYHDVKCRSECISSHIKSTRFGDETTYAVLAMQRDAPNRIAALIYPTEIRRLLPRMSLIVVVTFSTITGYIAACIATFLWNFCHQFDPSTIAAYPALVSWSTILAICAS